MIGLTLAGALTSLAVGTWWGSTASGSKSKPANLQTLQERIMHAKNLSMRMEELFRKEQQLMDEQASFSTLLSLKEETEWLLGLVEQRLLEGDVSELESVEALLDAAGKTLRLVLDIGQRPHMHWVDLEPSLIHIHKTLCLASTNQLPNDFKSESETIDSKFNGPHLIQLMIHQYRSDNIGLDWPFSVLRGRLCFEPLSGPARRILAVDPITVP